MGGHIYQFALEVVVLILICKALRYIFDGLHTSDVKTTLMRLPL